jgi:hypothetical protein
MPRARPTREAWFITGPGPDERLGSVVDRAASLYGTTGECLLGELIGEGEVGIGDVDCGGAAVVASIARAIQIAPRDLWQHRLQDHPSLLAPSARLAFCPACWQEDRAAGREPGLRREWSGVLRTMCARHAEPLRLSGPFLRGAEAMLSRRGNHPAEDDGEACLAAIDHFGRTLEGALFFGRPWPDGWAVPPQRVRSILLAVSLNLSEEYAFPPVSRLVYPSLLAGCVRPPFHAMSPFRGEPWEAFRAIADPALRRAAIWLVAWWTCPDWSERWRPGWTSREVPLDLLGVSRTDP